MIDQLTVDRIFAAADVVEVVREFVSLKKRGVNYIGLCPFHNEKTPSFTVSPAKGIYKCFGCGKGGNAVNFVMEHEQMSYVEALKYLAKKYNIEVEEKELTAEEIKQRTERDSLMIVTAWAQRYFTDNLHKHSEGKSVGLSYFRERGFRDDIIEKFQLGYGLEKRDALTVEAKKQGYKQEYLVKTGLSIARNDGSVFDRFYGRVIFPIHSMSGRVTAFGGRIMKTDAKAAKYLNSPESGIYHKSSVLYGIFFAKKAMTQQDKCFLVEGYTDVLSLHQAGIENVVASSGTALTPEQIRLIKRFTPNITVLYDGDPAGIKASLRGIDLILEEGLNVKVVLLPEGEDPDSFAKSHSATQVLTFIEENEADFINFKANLLLKDSQNDPVKRANLIRDIVKSISVISESITRSVYIRECTRILDIDESVLYAEVAKFRRARVEKVLGKSRGYVAQPQIKAKETPTLPSFVENVFCEEQEKEILYFLLKFGQKTFFEIPPSDDAEEELEPIQVAVGEHIISEILNDDLEFKNLVYKKLFDEYKQLMEQGKDIDERTFTDHHDYEISQLAVNLLTDQHRLSKIWSKHQAMPVDEVQLLHDFIPKAILVYKSKVIQMVMGVLHEELKNLNSKEQVEEVNQLLVRIMTINNLKNQISKELDRIVL
ncbi:MAG: DNA primase [Bacteroidales bacterium]|nr:DNA primase [Bacteroidales bacterium]MDD4671663.1 DNA primase [Bacteroidales bacterium]MDY0347794.1 DNA primase [Tenuifilaceae bacterium]